MFSMRRKSACLAISLCGIAGSVGAAAAQAWGEQAPVQFKYANQGLTNEVYRNQLGGAAAAASASASGGGLGSGTGQSSNQLDNAVQINNANTYNITVSGSSNYLNVSGDTVNAQQTSTGTSQTSSNSTAAATPPKNGSSPYLNK
jgi:hypothetical protein